MIPLQKQLDELLSAHRVFDLKRRSLILGDKRGTFTYFVGYTDPIATERILSALMALTGEELAHLSSLQELADRHVPFGSCELTRSLDTAADELLRGSATLTLEGFDDILIMDLRTFPIRPPEEPEKDRTLRGAHVGTGESMIANLIQIRRYLRSPRLQTERFLLGSEVKNEVALLSLHGKADEAFLERLRTRLSSCTLPNLSMTQETLAGILVPRRGLSLANPFPKVRYTERPDVVAASLMEGKVAVLCDNAPSIILLPQSIFDFFEEADDYYFPSVTASYLRLVRMLVFLASVLLIPIWLLAVQMGEQLPTNLRFVLAGEDYAVPLFLQFLIIEFAMDGLKMASLNTPSTLSGSFSVIGGLLLGEFAVESGWFVPQAILYSAFTGIANFVPTNIELGYSFKLIRISLILLVEFLGLWGLVGGIVFWLAVLFSTKGAAGKSYLYPLIPFRKGAMARILIRFPYGRERKTGRKNFAENSRFRQN